MTDITKAIQNLTFDPGMDISHAAAKTAETVQLYSAYVRNSGKIDDKEREHKTLELLYKRFFDYTDSWLLNIQNQKPYQEKDLDAANLKQKASNAINEIQRNIVRFAGIYMHIDRCTGIVAHELKNHTNAASRDLKDFKWSAQTGDVLKRYKIERLELGELYERFNKGREVISIIDPHYIKIEQLAQKLAGKDNATASLRSFRSALRTGNFDHAKKVIAELSEGKKGLLSIGGGSKQEATALKKLGENFVKTIESSEMFLQDAEGRFFFRNSELNVALQTLKREIAQKDALIDKYYGPYLDDKRKKFLHLKEKLHVFGSLQGLTTLYMKLVRGLATPMSTIQIVREYESDVIMHVDYILTGQFQEINNIENRTEDELEDFYSSVEAYQKVLNLRKTQTMEESTSDDEDK